MGRKESWSHAEYRNLLIDTIRNVGNIRGNGFLWCLKKEGGKVMLDQADLFDIQHVPRVLHSPCSGQELAGF